MYLNFNHNEIMNDMLLETLDELNGPDNSNPKFFSYKDIENVPFIDYPGLTKDENNIIMNMTKTVLTYSKRENNYNETTITYRLDKLKNPSDTSNYIITKGTENHVDFLTNDVADLLASTSDLLIISLHNHTDESLFSVSDLGIFARYGNIKIMALVNRKGDVSYLCRINQNNLLTSYLETIVNEIPDLKARLSKYTKNTAISEMLTPSEEIKIASCVLRKYEELGVCTSNNIKFFNNKDTNEMEEPTFE